MGNINWTKYFDAIYCLSLVDNSARRAALVKELKRVGIYNSGIFVWKITIDNPLYKYIWSNPKFPSGKYWNYRSGAFNCTLGHYEIMKECTIMKYKRVLILEDDVRFLSDLETIRRALDSIPDYDILLLDKFRPIDKEPLNKAMTENKINDYFFNFNNVKLWGASCYALSEKALTSLVERQEKSYTFSDYITNRVDGKGKVISDDDLIRTASIKNVAIQDLTFEKEKGLDDKVSYDGIANPDDYGEMIIDTSNTPDCISIPLSNKPENSDHPKYSVLSFIFGGYEKLHEIEEIDENAEYVMVTDDKNLKSNTWKIVYDEGLSTMSDFAKCLYVRYHPFKYVTNDIVVKIDGSILVKKSLRDIVTKFNKEDYDMSLMIHPTRNTLIPEYEAWETMRNYPREQTEKCVGMMSRFGYNFNYKGLYQACFSIQKNDKTNKDYNEITYSMLGWLGKDDDYERLDQTISSFILNAQFQGVNVMPVSESLITDSRYLQWCRHGTDVAIDDCASKIEPYLFNSPCKTVEF